MPFEIVRNEMLSQVVRYGKRKIQQPKWLLDFVFLLFFRICVFAGK